MTIVCSFVDDHDFALTDLEKRVGALVAITARLLVGRFLWSHLEIEARLLFFCLLA